MFVKKTTMGKREREHKSNSTTFSGSGVGKGNACSGFNYEALFSNFEPFEEFAEVKSSTVFFTVIRLYYNPLCFNGHVPRNVR